MPPTEKLPGEVFELPPGRAEPTDPKDRQYLLLNRVRTGVRQGTVAYCSTRATEARYRIEHILFDPAKTSYRGAGFTEPTFIYLGRLRPVPAHHLTQFRGRLIDDMPAARQALVKALGLRTGTASGTGHARGSNRGRIVEISPSEAERKYTPYGIVVTHPAYSKQQRYMTVVPLFLNVPRPQPLDIIIDDEPWLAELEGATRALAAAEEVYSPFWGGVPEKQEVIGLHPRAVVDEATMTVIEDRLIDYFELQEYV
jgi:hypothetical protein